MRVIMKTGKINEQELLSMLLDKNFQYDNVISRYVATEKRQTNIMMRN